MLRVDDLGSAFQLYWNDFERCQRSGAFFALLHTTVCLPDICAALESANGESTGAKYSTWCDKYFSHPELRGSERWKMRCKILHQGRAIAGQAGRYSAFVFGEPDSSGTADHLRVDGATLHVDVGRLFVETRQAVAKWISALESNPSSAESLWAAKHLKLLVRISPHKVPISGPGGATFAVVNKTN